MTPEEKAVRRLQTQVKWARWQPVLSVVACLSFLTPGIFAGWMVWDLRTDSLSNEAFEQDLLRDPDAIRQAFFIQSQIYAAEARSMLWTVMIFNMALAGIMLGSLIIHPASARRARLLLSLIERIEALEGRAPPAEGEQADGSGE